VIKDDGQLKGMDVPEGATIMLMGSAEGKGMDIENIEKKVFLEELTPEQKAKFYKETLGVNSQLQDNLAIWTTQPG
jgi:succinyl-CoA synthetase beta subunit